MESATKDVQKNGRYDFQAALQKIQLDLTPSRLGLFKSTSPDSATRLADIATWMLLRTGQSR